MALVPVLKALADPTRLRVFALLMEGVQCNCEISERLELSPSLISHHMRILEGASLVRSERDPEDARWIYYSVDEPALAGVAASLAAFLDVRRIRPRQPSCGPRACEDC